MSYEHLLQVYGFRALWNLDIMALTIVLASVYLVIVGPMRHRFTNSTDVSVVQKVFFLTGLFIFYFTLGSPLHLIGHQFLFSAHMLEQALVYMVMPPLFLLGTPTWFLRTILKQQIVKKLMVTLLNPMIAMLLFTVLFSFYHFPLIFDQINANHTLHNVFHIILTLAAFIMWWPIVDPLPEWNRLTELRKIGYLFISAVVLTPVCVLIIFANTPMYLTYQDVPRLFVILPPLDDQQLGGVIMKVVQELTYITAITITFFRWARKEKAKDTVDIAILNQ